MSDPMLEPRRRIVPIAVAVFAALALGSGKPARGEVSVFDEQAEATAVSTQALDVARSEARATWHAASRGDAAVINTLDWMEPIPPAWFPVTAEDESGNAGAADEATGAGLLALTPSPMRTAGLTDQAVAPQPEIISYEYAVIPLPPAAWTGLAGLASLATIGGRKALIRFFCN